MAAVLSIFLFLNSGKCVIAFMLEAFLDTVFPFRPCVLHLFYVMGARCSDFSRGGSQSFIYTKHGYHSAFGAVLPACGTRRPQNLLFFQLFNKTDLKLQKSAGALMLLLPSETAVLPRNLVFSSSLLDFLLAVFCLTFSLSHPALLMTVLS